MGLEILKALPSGPSGSPPLLFLHGACTGAWVWSEHFLDHMAAQGHAAYAISFRGHGRSGGRDKLWRYGLSDYVDDACLAIRALGRPPVLVGHSLGGMVAQRCLGREALAGLVLMAAVPPEGLVATHMHLALRDPALWLEIIRLTTTGLGARGPISPGLRRILFSDELPRAVADRYMSRMQQESRRVLAELQCPGLPPSAAEFGIPALVTGRTHDHLIPAAAMRRTAGFHGAEFHGLPGHAHALMLDAFWRDAAELLSGWLERTYTKGP